MKTPVSFKSSIATKITGTLLTVFLASASANAQSMALYSGPSSVTSSGVLNQQGGSIGVGTATPATGRLFNVVGPTQFDVAATGTGDGPGRVHFNRPTSSSYENMLSFETAGSYKWLVGLDNESSDNFRIFSPSGYQLTIAQSTGNVGIGSSAYIPFAKLQVGGDIVACTATTTSPVSCPLIHTTTAFSNASAPDYTWYGPSNTNTGMFHPATGVIGFSSSAAEKMRITSTGVGIGTTAPNIRFQVGNSINRATVCDLTSNANYWTSYVGLNLFQTGNNQWTTESNGSGNGGCAITTDVNGNMNFMTYKTGSLAQPMTDAQVYGMLAMRIRDIGRVEIGPKELNSSSAYESDPTTRLTVDGRIVAKDIVVSVVDFWPDYVFANDYKLMPLEQLHNYVNTNGHLPGVKPAAELEANGISVAETSKTQMQKIEELTLYMFQMNEKLKQLENENAALKKMITEK